MLFELCRCKRDLVVQDGVLEDKEASKILRKMTISKKLQNIYVSETFTKRIEKDGKTELALMQPAALKGFVFRIMIDTAEDLRCFKVFMTHAAPQFRLE